MKKLLSIVLSLSLLSGLLIIPLRAEGPAANSDYTTLLSIDFETGFTTSMTGTQIKEALGWTDWDLSVADLKIVDVGGNQKLQIIPAKVNQSTSARLIADVPLETAICADFEITPSQEGTLTDPFAATSHLAMGIAFPRSEETGENRVEQGLAITGRQVKRAFRDGEKTFENYNSWNTWYNNRMQKAYGALDVQTKKDTSHYSDGSNENYLFNESANADGYSFIYRMKIDPADKDASFQSFVAANDAAKSSSTAFCKTNISGTSPEDTELVKAVNGFIADEKYEGKVSLSLNYFNSGVSFLVDQITLSAESAISQQEIYKQDFEALTPDMTGAQIKEALGWTDWDLSVADLKIVETVYFREVNAKVGGTVAGDLAAAKVIHPGQTGAYNHVTVDVALLKTLDKYKNVDFTGYKTYNKKLAVLPRESGANGSISVMLAQNVPVSNQGLDSLTLDFELTPEYYTTLSDPSFFDSTSSLGLRVSGDQGDLSQALLITGALCQTATDKEGAATVNSMIAKDWYHPNASPSKIIAE